MTIATLLLAHLIAAAPGQSSEPVLLDFHSRGCGPCRQMRPVVDSLRPSFPIRTIDIERSPELAERYDVRRVPTFIVVDRAGRRLDETAGYQPAEQLAQFYQRARRKVRPPARDQDEAPAAADDEAAPADADEGRGDEGDDQAAGEDNREADGPDARDEPPAPAPVNPKPWESVVRIKIIGRGAIGFGSGTIIHSSPEESLILTCAHIFKLDGQKTPPPERFPRQITVDLFDGQLRGRNPAQVHFVEAVEGEAVDYDFTLDVGLIRIRPGRRLPASRVVPAHWQPKPRMRMWTVGCSQGQDATAWPTMILNPKMQGLSNNPSYQAIECVKAPLQGRSGGGLYTTDHYVAGVCNFAEPRGDHGLYATPASIYKILDRNDLASLYAPVNRGAPTLIAGRQDPSAGVGRRRDRPGVPVTVMRGQSPGPEDPDAVGLPHPSLLGIPDPGAEARPRGRQVAAGAGTRRIARHQAPGWTARTGAGDPPPAAEATDLSLDPSADRDPFTAPPREEGYRPARGAVGNPEDVTLSPPVDDPGRGSAAGKSRWRSARSATSGSPITPADGRDRADARVP